MCGENSLGWIHCEASSYKPGLKLCSYLLKNARIEYAQDNLNQAIRCLVNEKYAPINNALVELFDVSYFFSEVKGVKDDVYISIGYKKIEKMDCQL